MDVGWTLMFSAAYRSSNMRRYAALLRGVSPSNAKMADLKKAFEAAGFADVKTVLSSGNVVFTAREAAEASLGRRAQEAMTQHLGTAFLTIVRPIDALRELLAADPYTGFHLQPGAKRVVTFLRHTPAAKMNLPIEVDGACILTIRGREVFTAYVQSSKGAVFMTLIEKTFGKEATTRTWDSIAKIAR
jgi:uncharacterized protein (DUF1697 family)